MPLTDKSRIGYKFKWFLFFMRSGGGVEDPVRCPTGQGIGQFGAPGWTVGMHP